MPTLRTFSCGTFAAALALPSVNRPLSSRNLPLIVPPIPLDLIASGPVTVAAMSPRSSSRALTASRLRLSALRPPEKSIVPLPEIVPPPGVAPPIWVSASRDPLNRPAAVSRSITVPVTALSSRAPLAWIDPRICGSTIRPPMSAPIATGPDRSKISTPDKRHNVSAGPA